MKTNSVSAWARRFLAILLLRVLLPSAEAQPYPVTAGGYSMITGVDSTRWTVPGTMMSAAISGSSLSWNADRFYNYFFTTFRQHVVSRAGGFYINSTPQADTGFPDGNIGVVWGWRNRCSSSPGNYRYTYGSGRYVAGFSGSVDTSAVYTRDWQVVFDNNDKSVTLVYGPPRDTLDIAEPIGFQYDANTLVAINPRSHTISPNPVADTDSLCWPGAYRFYKFMPECFVPSEVQIDSFGADWACLSWTTDSGFWFGMAIDSTGRGISADGIRWTTGTHVRFDSLREGGCYDFYLVSPCFLNDGSYSHTCKLAFCTTCPAVRNRIDYDFHSPLAVCRTGTTSAPSARTGCVDYGRKSEYSRHTMHCDSGEFDPRTGGLLRTVPPGYAASVRLGNWRSGAEQEDVTYTLHVDTNDYDLLLLRYALVEQQPSHGPQENPRFLYSINDSLGSPIGSCYSGNFVSGDNSGWNSATNFVLWKDWTAVAIDLGPFHGQDIQVNVSNYDCGQGGHYGYGYFVLDGSTKHVNSETCGDEVVNLFHAPEGFAYRWYPDGHPELTLSTADSLRVTEEGSYTCDVHYLMGDTSCGFTMHTYAGPRYPVADFVPEAVDSCARRFRFLNLSRITHDEERTQPSGLSCEGYLWDFGDGSVSQEKSPLHAFPQYGTYTVTLRALLAGGRCSDSLSLQVVVGKPSSDICDTICLGENYFFFSDTLSATGDYLFDDTCRTYRLHLVVRDRPQDRPGCESVCRGEPGYRFLLADTLCYRFSSSPADSLLPQGAVQGSAVPRQWVFMPADTLVLALVSGYGGRLVCPVADTFRLEPFSPLRIRLTANLDEVTMGSRNVEVVDHGDSAWLRRWFVNGTLQDEDGPRLCFIGELSGDSVRVRLEASDEHCSDTARLAIPIRSGEPWFPNVFTPDAETNSRFRGYGSNIRGYQLEIYTKWGDRFFQTNDIAEGWDGTRNGRRCPASAYVYVCHYTGSDGKPQTLFGTVLLIR